MRIFSGKPLALAAGILLLATATWIPPTYAATMSKSQSTGVEGTVNSAPPARAPTISSPSNGQSFSSLPVTVNGLCDNGLLVEVFKNGVFAGSATCAGGSYSISIDLFNGRNDLIARQYDGLNQSSPGSATVTVTFNNALPQAGPRISLITAFAKRGANPGSPLSWPITISGGEGPYAISADWGDGSPAQLLSQALAGNLTLEHTYNQSGVYSVTIKASDKNSSTAYLQVVGIGNGPIQQSSTTTAGSGASVISQKQIIWWPIILLAVLVLISFWLGSRHQLEVIRDRLRRGERPFK